MYDPKSEPREFLSDTRAEAVAKACSFFGEREEGLEIVEVDASRVAGTGGRVVIVAYPKGVAPRGPRSSERGPSERRDRGDRPDRRDRGGRADRGDRRPPGRDARRREGPERSEPPAHREAPERREAVDRPEVSEPSEPSVAQVRTPLSPLGEFVQGVVERMDLGPFEISETAQGEAGELRVCQLGGPAAEQLGGGDGRVADAIQLLGNQAALRIGEGNQRLVLEIEGDTEARESLLSRAAERAARRAISTGRAVALEAMSPKDRRVIHMALREMEGIATMSIGDGRFRQVVVVPEGASEYEQARDYEASAAATRGNEE